VGSVYLGAWVNPDATGPPSSGQNTPGEMVQVPAFNQSVGRAMSIYALYTAFSRPPSASVLDAIHSYGATPFVSWSCADVGSVASGADDSEIQAYANALRSYGYPVLLRWYWEMNSPSGSFNQSCGGVDDPSGYIAAWRHVRTLFEQDGASNVAFVWNPSRVPDASSWYPGDGYVDWIGVDGYDIGGTGDAAFGNLFGAFYREWSGQGKPLLVGETGATSADQTAFIDGMETDIGTEFPDIKAVVYWDAVGSRADWVLSGPGLSAFSSMAATPFFGFRGL
jgi:beta-mannanase